MDDKDGLYFNSTITLARKNFPASVSSLINQPIKTNIEICNEFLWNLSITYSFGKENIEK